MKNLDVHQSVVALFALCSDVSRLNAYGDVYFYFVPKHRDNLKVMKYILKANGIRSELHRSSYYGGGYGMKSLVLRMPVSYLIYDTVPEFRQEFETVYNDKYNALNKVRVSNQDTRWFRLFPVTKKIEMIKGMVANTK